MRVKSGVAALTAALVAVGAVGFVASQAPGDPVAIPAPVVQSVDPEMLSSEEDPAAQPGAETSQPVARKLPASGDAATAAPTIPPHSGPLIDAFEYQEDPFLPRPGEGQSPTTIVPDIDVRKASGEGNGLLIVPVNGRETSPFGMRFHPVLKRWKLHTGLDFAASCGTPIGASAAGRVTRAGWGGGYGNMVMIDHGTIGGHKVTTLYAHLSSAAVRVGDQVAQGQGIGRVGNTGYSTGCHLHFEVRVNGTFANPKDWLEGRMVVNPEVKQEVAFDPEPSPSASPSPSPSESESPSTEASTSPSPSAEPSAPLTPSAPASSDEPSPSDSSRDPSRPANPSEEPTSGEPTSKEPSKPVEDPSQTPKEPSESPSPSPSPSPSREEESPSESPSPEVAPSAPPATTPDPVEPSAPVEEPLPEPPTPSE